MSKLTRIFRLKWSKEITRYAVVGTATNLLGFLLYVLFTKLGMSPVKTISIFYLIQIGFAFYFNKKWSFNYRGRLSTSAIRYLIAYFGCYVLNFAMLEYFYGYLGLSHVIVQAAVVMVVVPLLFLIQEFWVFRREGGFDAE
jgi:putative flippase GtrA